VHRHHWWHVDTTISDATRAIHDFLRAGTAFAFRMGQ
jgi:hypothetical protein